jgi:hypothetical protein
MVRADIFLEMYMPVPLLLSSEVPPVVDVVDFISVSAGADGCPFFRQAQQHPIVLFVVLLIEQRCKLPANDATCDQTKMSTVVGGCESTGTDRIVHTCIMISDFLIFYHIIHKFKENLAL